MSHSRIQDLLNLSNAHRWTIRPTLRPQSVAEHSYRVAVIAMEICRAINGEHLPSSNVIEYHVILWALVHDGPECETGDIPYTAKKNFPDGVMNRTEAEACPWYGKMRSILHPPELAIIKIADKVEEILFLRDWGTAGSKEAYEMAFKLVCERVWEAQARFGWSNLPSVVGGVIGSGSRLPVQALTEPPVQPESPASPLPLVP